MKKWNEKKVDEKIRRIARRYYRVVEEMEKEAREDEKRAIQIGNDETGIWEDLSKRKYEIFCDSVCEIWEVLRSEMRRVCGSEMKKVDEGEDWEIWSDGKRYVYVLVAWDNNLWCLVREGRSEEEAKEGEDIYEFYF